MMTLAELRGFLEPWERYGLETWHDALTWGP